MRKKYIGYKISLLGLLVKEKKREKIIIEKNY